MNLLSFSLIALIAVGSVSSQPSTQAPPGQPTYQGEAGKFVVLGNSMVNGQQLFLGRPDKVYLVDKVENNPTTTNGHAGMEIVRQPSEGNGYRNQQLLRCKSLRFYGSSELRPANGNVLGNGTWINIGGNQAVTTGGNPAGTQDGTSGPYKDADGRKAIRLLDPCDGDDCGWSSSPFQTEQRWYPTVETLADGSVIILGGAKNGGYVNDAGQTNPTYEFFPPNGPAVQSAFLENTLPTNLYPLTWLLPSNKLLVQATRSTMLLDPVTKVETSLDDMPDAVRAYPASAGTVMMPLTPANNYTATIMFCGGSDVATDQWTSISFIPISRPASMSCVRLTPDVSGSYIHDDPLPERRSMANLILLPDGKILCLNGARMGTAGYGTTAWSIGQSYADEPVLTPVIYDPDAPAGSRWSSNGLSPSTVPRMYHSSALLLPDGSVMVSGSNPNADFISPADATFATEYRTERFFPPYYNQRRPQPKGLVQQLTYGGTPFDVVLDSDDLFGKLDNVDSTKVVVVRPGFSTHSMNMGQRMVVLRSTYTGFSNNTAILHVSQLPPNPSVLAPGPAFLFIVVKGTPSVGVPVLIGSGKIEAQNVLPVVPIPDSTVFRSDSTTTSATTSATPKDQTSRKNGTKGHYLGSNWWLLWPVVLFLSVVSF